MSYHVVWLGVEKAKADIHGDHSLWFDQLRWYLDAMMRYNPESYVNIDYDASSQQFCRFFVSFVACISGFNSCRPLLFLDRTFLKGKYKGQLLAATAKDGNNGLFPVAFVIVDSRPRPIGRGSCMNLGRGMRYGEMTSNAAESFNNWIKEARNLPITQMVDTICTQLMRQIIKVEDMNVYINITIHIINS
ncbi:uncharacterized protein LOC114289406 [Camellia sinensis]|uniref:uncharacterized protein LOC114289406 n=1 Tax=Camellia sinensis TaxID=4442 RepID=UPI0010367C4B|nr:uncharacterized protein LOC114289406 [Camellia sinensis]